MPYLTAKIGVFYIKFSDWMKVRSKTDCRLGLSHHSNKPSCWAEYYDIQCRIFVAKHAFWRLDLCNGVFRNQVGLTGKRQSAEPESPSRVQCRAESSCGVCYTSRLPYEKARQPFVPYTDMQYPSGVQGRSQDFTLGPQKLSAEV